MNTSKPTAVVRAENAVRAWEAILSKRNAANREEREEATPPARGIAESQTHGDTGQDGSARDSIFQVRKDAETGGDSLPKFDKMVEQTGIHSRQMAEQWSERKSSQADWQDAGADENLSSEFGMASSRTEIHSRQTAERKDERKSAHSDRQDFETSGNSSPETGRTPSWAEISLPETGGTQEQSEIFPRQPTEPADFQNAYRFQSQQNAETHRNAAPRTRQDAMTNGNTASEKRDDTREGFHDIIEGRGSSNRETKTTPPGTHAEEEERLERMNAAYEHDRVALAKTDPAFAHGTFRDVGHAEGGNGTDGHALRKILSIEKTNLMVDLENEKEAEKKE